MSKKHPVDVWFNIFWGMVTKKTGISKLNLIQMEYHHQNILAEQAWLTLELVEKINNILGRKNTNPRKTISRKCK